ncbi:TPA: phage protein NinX family protein [Pseudomonas aeruginosa]
MNMVEVQTEELIGAALDWAIATIEGLPIQYDPMAFGNTANGGYWIWDKAPGGMMAKIGDKYSPSSNWSQLGPLIEKRAIVLGNHESGDPSRQGEFWGSAHCFDSGTSFETYKGIKVAACRAIVAKEMGPVVRVPKVLVQPG